MATKAQDFRYQQERAGPKKGKAAARHHRRGTGGSFPSRRNRSKAASRRARSTRRAGRAGV